MKATNAKVKKYEKGSMLAFVDLEFDNCMWINGWKLFKGKEGREFDLGFPSEIDKKGARNEDGSPKYWNFVFIDLKNGEEGKRLLSQTKELVVERYLEQSGGSAPSSSSSGSFDDDDIPF